MCRSANKCICSDICPSFIFQEGYGTSDCEIFREACWKEEQERLANDPESETYAPPVFIGVNA